MEIKLIVIRTNKTKELSEFYSLLGFVFEYHKHGDSPLHYSTKIDKTIFEIYPLSKNQIEAETNLRLGFCIDDFEMTIKRLKDNNISFSDPTLTEFGFLTIIQDLDGRKIELYKK